MKLWCLTRQKRLFCSPCVSIRLQKKRRFVNLLDLRTKTYPNQLTQHRHLWRRVCPYDGLLLRFVLVQIMNYTCWKKVWLVTPNLMTTPFPQQIRCSASGVNFILWSFFAIVGEVCITWCLHVVIGNWFISVLQFLFYKYPKSRTTNT